MKYILIILTVLSAIVAELVGLTHEGVPWSKFPHNLTKGGLFFLFLTIVLGATSLYVLAIDEQRSQEDKDKLNTTIAIQEKTIAGLKDEIINLKSDLKKYQHPIPEKFQIWLTMEFDKPKEELEKQLKNFDVFESVYVAFLFHGQGGPKIFGIHSKGFTTKELIREKKINVREDEGKLIVTVMWLDLDIGENNTNYVSIYDMCGKGGELRVELTKNNDLIKHPFNIKKMSLFTPTKNEMTIENIMVKNAIGSIMIKDNCWI